MRIDHAAARAQALALVADSSALVGVTLAGRLSGTTPPYTRIDVRPVLIREEMFLQFACKAGDGTRTENLPLARALEFLEEQLAVGYANVTVRTTDVIWQCRITKRRVALIHEERREGTADLNHDRAKRRLLDPADPFLIAVGISDERGKIKPSKNDKYRQIDEFVRIVAASVERAVASGRLPMPETGQPLRVVDLGCGYAYLTFAVASWAERIKGWPIEVFGVDRRPESVVRNQLLAEELGASSMTFIASDIADSEVPGDHPVGVVLALHACDTATDDALAWAIQRRAPLVLAAPCCHHDLQRQISKVEPPSPYGSLTRHDLLRERFADVATDALRAAILRQHGYRVDVLEFVGGEHTPRNVLIRAVRTDAPPSVEVDEELKDFSTQWGVTPALTHRLTR